MDINFKLALFIFLIPLIFYVAFSVKALGTPIIKFTKHNTILVIEFALIWSICATGVHSVVLPKYVFTDTKLLTTSEYVILFYILPIALGFIIATSTLLGKSINGTRD